MFLLYPVDRASDLLLIVDPEVPEPGKHRASCSKFFAHNSPHSNGRLVKGEEVKLAVKVEFTYTDE